MSKPRGLPREPSRAEEDELVERIQRGDDAAYDALVLGYTHAMSTFVLTQSKGALTPYEALSVAWDVLQMARPRWDPSRYPHSRFLHYARYYIRSGIRRFTSHDPRPLEFSGPKTPPRREMPEVLKAEDPTLPEVSTTDTVEEHELTERMFDAIKRIRDPQVRQVMLLAAEGLDIQAIGKKLRQPRSTVHGRFARGLVLLRIYAKNSRP